MTENVGPTDRTRGLRSQVKPTFMLPALGTSLLGGLLAPSFEVISGLLYVSAVGAALYVAHLIDEYVDAHVRGEEPPSVSIPVIRPAVIAASGLCLMASGVLWIRGQHVAGLTGPILWLLAVFHAPHLDTHPVGVTFDYPVGIGLTVVGGYAAQAGVPPASVVGMGAVLVTVLAAVKVSLDRLDREFDRTVGKRTVPVLVDDRGAARVNAGLLVGAAALAGGSVAIGILPRGSLLVIPITLVAAVVGLTQSPARMVRYQMALVYPIAAVLFITSCLATDCALEQWFGL